MKTAVKVFEKTGIYIYIHLYSLSIFFAPSDKTEKLVDSESKNEEVANDANFNHQPSTSSCCQKSSSEEQLNLAFSISPEILMPFPQEI